MQDGKLRRRWQKIAEEASREQDPERLLELAHELEAAQYECTKQAGDSDKKRAQTAAKKAG